MLCVAHGGVWWAAWLAPVPLLFALRGASVREAFYVGLVCGVIEPVVVVGILFAGWPVYSALSLSYVLARLAFALLYVALRADSQWLGPIVPAAAWVAVEIVHGAVPYAAPTILGNTQHAGPLLGLARVGGAYLISMVLVWMAAAVVEILVRKTGAPIVLFLLALFFLGWTALFSQPFGDHPMSVAVAQGGLPTWVYTRAEDDPRWRGVPQAVYAELTRRVQPDAADLTVWPETAVWRFWGADPDYERSLRKLARRQGAMLVGAPREDAGGGWYNSAVLIDTDGQTVADKRHLALLAEHRFTPGEEIPIMNMRAPGAPRARLGVVFCLETVTPIYAADLAARGAEVLVVLAEGSRFGSTGVGELHARYSILRAVEAGRYLVHAGQHGFSTIISPFGERIEPLPPYVAGVVIGDIQLIEEQTPYARWGRWMPLVPGLVILAAAYAALARRRRRS